MKKKVADVNRLMASSKIKKDIDNSLTEIDEPFSAINEAMQTELVECVLSNSFDTKPSNSDSVDLPSTVAISVDIKSEPSDADCFAERYEVSLTPEHCDEPNFSNSILQLLEFIPPCKGRLIKSRSDLELRRLQVQIANLADNDELSEIVPVLLPLKQFLKSNCTQLAFVQKHYNCLLTILSSISVDSFKRFHAACFENEAKIDHPLVDVILNLLKMTNNPNISVRIELDENYYTAEFNESAEVILTKESSENPNDDSLNPDRNVNSFIPLFTKRKQTNELAAFTGLNQNLQTGFHSFSKVSSRRLLTEDDTTVRKGKSKASALRDVRKNLVSLDELFNNGAEPQPKKLCLSPSNNSVINSVSDQELIRREREKLEQEKQMIVLKLKEFEQEEREIERMKQELKKKIKLLELEQSVMNGASTFNNDCRNLPNDSVFSASVNVDTSFNFFLDTNHSNRTKGKSERRRISSNSVRVNSIISPTKDSSKQVEKSLRVVRKCSGTSDIFQQNVDTIAKENLTAIAKANAAKQLLRYEGEPVDKNVKVSHDITRSRSVPQAIEELGEVVPFLCIDNLQKLPNASNTDTKRHSALTEDFVSLSESTKKGKNRIIEGEVEDLINSDLSQQFDNAMPKRVLKGSTDAKPNCSISSQWNIASTGLGANLPENISPNTSLSRNVPTEEMESLQELPFDPLQCQFEVFDPITCCAEQGKVPNKSHAAYLRASMKVVSHKLLVSDYTTSHSKIQTIPCLVAACLDIYIYVCPRCRFQTNCRFRFRLHSYTHSYTMYKCRCCSFKSSSKWKTDEHEVKHLYSVFSVKCDLCDIVLFDEKGLPKHKQQHSVPSEAEPKCFECGFVGENFLQVRIHYIHAHGIPTLKMRIECEICSSSGHKFSNFSDLGEHMKTHMASDGKTFVCHSCDFTTTKLPEIEYHSRSSHKKSKSFECEICLYKTSNRMLFSRHKKIKCQAPNL